MAEPDNPIDEAARLAALDSYGILDTPPERAFDDIAHLAATLFGTRIALVSLVDATRQWSKAAVGIEPGEVPRQLSFCARAILSPEPLVVLDASRDARFAANPLVTGKPGIRFYAGAPLITGEGYNLGTVCIVDMAPRERFSAAERETLARLARLAVAALDLRRSNQVLESGLEAKAAVEQKFAIANALAESAVQARNFEEAMRLALGILCRAAEADFAQAWRIVSPEGRCILVADHAGEADPSGARVIRFARGSVLTPQNSIVVDSIVMNRPIAVPDLKAQDLSAYDATREAVEMGLRAGLVLPLWIGEARFGVTLSYAAPRPDIDRILTWLMAQEPRLRSFLVRKLTEDRSHLLESALNCALDAVMVIRSESIKPRDPRIVYANPAFVAMTGYEMREVIGRDPRFLGGPAPPAEITDEIRRALAAAKPIRTALPNQRKDGSFFWAEVNIAPVTSGGEPPEYWISVMRDITERREAGQRLEKSERAFRQLFRSAPLPMWVYDRETLQILEVNERAVRYLGYSREQSLQMTILDLHRPEDASAVREALAAYIEGRPGRDEWRLPTASGSYVDAVVLTRLLTHAGREAILATLIDVSDRVAAETALARREKDLEAAMRVARLGIWRWHPADDTLECSDELYILLGYDPRDEAVRRLRAQDVVYPEDWEQVRQALIGGLVSRRRFEVEFRAPRRNDSGLRWMWLEGWCESGPSGEVETMVGITQDVTERKNAERLLVQSQKMETVGHLTGGIAHDFNNLLAVILGNADILAGELPPGNDLRRMAEMTRAAAQRGAELTQRLLAFARRQPLSPAAFDAGRLARETADLMARTLGEHIEIEVVQAAGLWQAFADRLQVETALINLALNARDAMPQGGRLTIEAGNAFFDQEYAAENDEVRPGQYVMFAISDNGMGMEKGVAERAFEPFFTTKAVGRGSGLGLSMVYGFAKQSGGHIKIYSEMGVGTTVKLYLPRAGQSASAERLDAGAPPRALPRGGETILVAEDDPMVRDFVCGHLRALGYQVLEAKDGIEALAHFEAAGRVDLLLTDIVMPRGLNGRELAERIVEQSPGTKILFSSGYTENAIVHQGRLDPGIELLRKPYRKADLARHVRRLLDAAGPVRR